LLGGDASWRIGVMRGRAAHDDDGGPRHAGRGVCTPAQSYRGRMSRSRPWWDRYDRELADHRAKTRAEPARLPQSACPRETMNLSRVLLPSRPDQD